MILLNFALHTYTRLFITVKFDRLVYVSKAPRGGLGGRVPPPFVTEANFLIRPNPVRKGGGVR